MATRFLSLALAALLTGCDGGGEDGTASGVVCQVLSGAAVSFANAGTSGTVIQNGAAVADGDLGSFASIITNGGTTQTASIRATSALEYPAGSRAAVFLTGPSSSGGTGFNTTTLNTYLDGAPQESASGPALEGTDTEGRTAAGRLLSFETTLPFDAVEILVSTNSTGAGTLTHRIHELCAEGRLE